MLIPQAIVSQQVAVEFQPYVPVWTTDGTPPSLGNGTLTGSYAQIGDIVIAFATLVAGSTTTFGTSFWHISLPVTPSVMSTNGDYGLVGTCWDISATTQFFASWRRDNYVFTMGSAAAHGNLTPVTASAPMAWADTDRLEIGRIYQAA